MKLFNSFACLKIWISIFFNPPRRGSLPTLFTEQCSVRPFHQIRYRRSLVETNKSFLCEALELVICRMQTLQGTSLELHGKWRNTLRMTKRTACKLLIKSETQILSPPRREWRHTLCRLMNVCRSSLC